MPESWQSWVISILAVRMTGVAWNGALSKGRFYRVPGGSRNRCVSFKSKS